MCEKNRAMWSWDAFTLQQVPGPQFLWVYGGMVVGSALAFVMTARFLRGGPLQSPDELPAVDLALVEGDAIRPLEVAVLELLIAGALERVDGGMVQKLKATGKAPPNDEPLHQAILQQCQKPSGYNRIAEHRGVKKALAQARRRLVQRNWLARPWLISAARLTMQLWLIVLIFMGWARIYLGLTHLRPVTYLVYEVIASIFLLLFAIEQCKPITLAAAAYLKKARKTKAALGVQARTNETSLGADDRALALVLFNMAPALAGLEYFSSPVMDAVTRWSSWVQSRGGGGGGGGYESPSYSSSSCGASPSSSCSSASSASCGSGGSSSSAGCGG